MVVVVVVDLSFPKKRRNARDLSIFFWNSSIRPVIWYLKHHAAATLAAKNMIDFYVIIKMDNLVVT